MTPSAPMMTVWVDGVGVLGPGIDHWAQAQSILCGHSPYALAATVLPAPAILPPAERRRASRVIKASLAVGLEAAQMAGQNPAQLANVFASSGGDGHNCHALCELLAGDDRQVSPTRFHNSVHNAASGYWAIATGATPPAQVLGAHDASFAAGLFEAMVQVQTFNAPVLLVAADSEYPEPLHAKRPIADTSGIALVLSPQASARSIGQLTLDPRHYLRAGTAPGLTIPGLAPLADVAQQMPPWRGMPLLAALAGVGAGSEVLDLPWLSGQVMQLQVQAIASTETGAHAR